MNTTRLCPFKGCHVCLKGSYIDWSFGYIDCPCDFLPGWRSEHYEGLPKPRVKALPRGRHGGRIARSIRRHQTPDMSWIY